MSDTVYCYPGTDILINKLNIRSQEKLTEAERRISNLELADLLTDPVKGDFDFAHLQWIHRYIFKELYDWAGKIRTVNIAKGNLFCPLENIASETDRIFGELKKEKLLLKTSEKKMPARLAYYISEINALHPFREGNGRAQREYIRELALNAGYDLNLSNISPEEMLQASTDSFVCNYEKMTDIMKRSLSKIQ